MKLCMKLYALEWHPKVFFQYLYVAQPPKLCYALRYVSFTLLYLQQQSQAVAHLVVKIFNWILVSCRVTCQIALLA